VSGPEPLRCTRVAATPAAIDALPVPAGVTALRLAPDDLLLLGDVAVVVAGDRDAIVCADDGWAVQRLTPAEADRLVATHGDWLVPATGTAQGSLAGIPVKLQAAGEAVALVVPRPYLADALERLR
jgi:hypothetical protein